MVVGPPAEEMELEETDGLLSSWRAASAARTLLTLPLLRLELLELVANGVVEPLPVGEAALDLLPALGPVGHDAPLLGPRLPQLVGLHAVALAGTAHVLQDALILLGDPVGGVSTVERLVEAARPQQDLEERLVATGTRPVDGDDTGGEALLGDAVRIPRDLQPALRGFDVRLDRRELRGREVVRVDGLVELRVDALELLEDGLHLGALRFDRSRGSESAGSGHESRERRGCHEGEPHHATALCARSHQGPGLGGPCRVRHGRGW